MLKGYVPANYVTTSVWKPNSCTCNVNLSTLYATFEQIVQACKMAKGHPVIEALPQGYQTEIGEHGTGLSGGQK